MIENSQSIHHNYIVYNADDQTNGGHSAEQENQFQKYLNAGEGHQAMAKGQDPVAANGGNVQSQDGDNCGGNSKQETLQEIDQILNNMLEKMSTQQSQPADNSSDGGGEEWNSKQGKGDQEANGDNLEKRLGRHADKMLSLLDQLSAQQEGDNTNNVNAPSGNGSCEKTDSNHGAMGEGSPDAGSNNGGMSDSSPNEFVAMLERIQELLEELQNDNAKSDPTQGKDGQSGSLKEKFEQLAEAIQAYLDGSASNQNQGTNS